MISKAKYKICRRLGPVYEKCQTQKFLLSEARRGGKGGAGKKPKALSEYGTQLIEKQKIRYSYGITERQLGNYIKQGTKSHASQAPQHIFEMLEQRLDNVVYRLGLAPMRTLARQMVAHGHITLNGKKMRVPAAQVKVGDVIGIREGSRKSPLFQDLPKKLKNYSTPTWLTFDAEKGEGKVTGKPKNSEGFININTVLEFYSR